MGNAYSKGGGGSHFSKAAKEEIYSRIRAGEFTSVQSIQEAFGVSDCTARTWMKTVGCYPSYVREIESHARRDAMDGKTGADAVKEKWKGVTFVEPDPGVGSFRSEREALEYYRLRADYLESLYMLVDEPTDVKKKALRQLEERIRERMAKGGTSV